MQALILAGGKGTRLRPLTLYTPKPIVPVVNRPFLLYQIDALARAGIRDITLSLSYQPGKIEDVLARCSDLGVDLRFVTEPSPMGTGGAYKFAADGSSEPTIVFNGDILTDVDVASLIRAHQSAQAVATIALARVEDPTAYGLVETDGDGLVRRFLEKPTAETLETIKINTINAGIYVLEPKVLDLIPKNVNTSFEYNVFPQILESGLKFNSFDLGGSYWRDIGNPASYLAAHLDFLAGKVSGFQIGSTGISDIATAAVVDRVSVIDGECVIKPNARVISSVLGPGIQVEENAYIENSVIWAHARIAAGASIVNAVIGRGTYVGRSVTISPGAVIGDKATLPDYTKV